MESSDSPIHNGPPDRSPPSSNASVEPVRTPPTIIITEPPLNDSISARGLLIGTATLSPLPSARLWVHTRSNEATAPKSSDTPPTTETSSELSSDPLLEVNTDPSSLPESRLTSKFAATGLILPPRWSWEPSADGHALFLCSAIPQWLIMSETHPFSSAFIDLPGRRSTAPVGILPSGCSAIMLPSGRVLFWDNPPAQTSHSHITDEDPLQERYTNLDPRTGQIGQPLRKWPEHNDLTLFDHGQTQFHENSFDRMTIAP